MDINEQTKTWAGFMALAKWGTVSIFSLVLLLTIFFAQ
ncbi:MAG: aa3-type cytochrome c oxidase subunit IV [Pseudomonadota bacterium]